MKILFTFYNPSGGMDTLNRIRCEALQKIGIECHMLYKFDGNGRRNIKHIKTHIGNTNKDIEDLLQRENYDAIIVCTDFELLQKIRASGYKNPLIYEIQGLGTMETAVEILKYAEANVNKYASALLYPRTAHIMQLLETFFPDKKHYSFDDPLNMEDFGYTSYPQKKYSVIAWVGRIEANKNWRDFIELGYQLSQSIPNLYLWMFGDMDLNEPGEQKKFEEKIVELGIEDRVIRYSNVPHEQMADYFSMIGDSGGFLCSTSILEGFGYAVAEAMLCRCPVLTTDSDGVRNFIFHNETGLFFPHGDIDQAVVLAKQLMYNAELRNHIRTNGERYVKVRFTVRKYTKKFMAMLGELGVQ
ncbi:glycosyltransferase [Paenibacillus alba]|uniref:glycosyltransferase family 4 protein n=1 Tax=Paenibacillus alba TaxID=1197127 RepID=UPI0015654D95|nr:glycosyltransferase [Paenibacillus alba]NQX69337.1 glycosyltransferase [Paenibacillus alba]